MADTGRFEEDKTDVDKMKLGDKRDRRNKIFGEGFLIRKWCGILIRKSLKFGNSQYCDRWQLEFFSGSPTRRA